METSPVLIKGYSDNLLAKLKALKSTGAPLPFGLSNFPVAIKIDVAGSQGLADLISQSGCSRVVALFGIDPVNNELTLSFFALDSTGNIDARHVSGALPGHETWPVGDITTFPSIRGWDSLSLPDINTSLSSGLANTAP